MMRDIFRLQIMDFTNVRLEMGSPLSAPDFLKRPDIDDDLLFAILVLKRD